MASPFPVLYRDDDLLVVDKPSGWLSVPDRYDPDAPVVVRDLKESEGELFVVHRLDKDTSGVLIFARNADAHRALSEAFETRAVAKTYEAIVRGSPTWDEEACELPLKVDGDRRHRTIVDAGRGKACKTLFVVKERYRGSGFSAAHVEARPETGRTHQIRVHLSALGYPVLCDPLYGSPEPLLLSKVKGKWKGDAWSERPLISRTALHAASAEFPHPRTGQPTKVEAPLPKDMRATLTQLAKL
jgi:RluA family pseudouridine synthase